MSEDLKKCSKCDTEKELSEFSYRKDTQKYRNHCRDCIKLINEEYQTKNKDKIKIQRKEYSEKTKNLKRMYDIDYRERNREKIKNYKKQYMRKRRQSDMKFKLICNIRTRTNKAFISRNIKKTTKTIDLLGCSREFFKNWILHQLYGNMTEENYGSIWQIDHCLSIASCNLLDENDMKKCFNWVNLRPMYSTENNLKGSKIDHRLYLLQQIKAKYFMKLNEEGFNENIH